MPSKKKVAKLYSFNFKLLKGVEKTTRRAIKKGVRAATKKRKR